jgi:lysozyme
MKTSTQGLTILIEREGAKNHAYLDTVGVWTIGVGHTGPEVHEGLVWTDEQVREAFAKDIERFEQAVSGGLHVPLDQWQFDALVSFTFNVGAGAFASSTLRQRVNAQEWEAAAHEFDRWHIPPEITPRRNAEREQFKGKQFAARIE